jgi:hypothetical protein
MLIKESCMLANIRPRAFEDLRTWRYFFAAGA